MAFRSGLVVLVASAWVTGCVGQESSKPIPEGDIPALEAALLDLLDSKDSPLLGNDREGNRLFLAPESRRRKLAASEILKSVKPDMRPDLDQSKKKSMFRDDLERHESWMAEQRRIKAQWDALSTEQLASIQQAAENLASRSAEAVSFREFKRKDKRIVIESGPARYEDILDKPRPCHAHAPGFSADRKFAVVRMSFPWSEHSGEGTYVLERKGEKWVILFREIIYFV